MTCKDRVLIFHKADVPSVLKITMQPFITDDGEHVAGTNLNVLSSPVKSKTVYIELNSTNLAWLSKACQRTTTADEGDGGD